MMYPNTLPPQQIVQANGKQSIDMLRMSPNSSILIADSTAPIVWKCVSDGLGNVTAEAFDISPHKSEEQIEKDNMLLMLNDISNRLKKLEDNYDQSYSKWNKQPDADTGKTDNGGTKERKQSSRISKTDDE